MMVTYSEEEVYVIENGAEETKRSFDDFSFWPKRLCEVTPVRDEFLKVFENLLPSCRFLRS